MRTLFLILVSILFLPSKSQSLELVKNQWEAIANAKTAEEKLMRNCKMARTLPATKYDGENNQLYIEESLNQIDGFSDLIDSSYRIRLISWYFEIEDGKYQYNYKIACSYKKDDLGFMFGFGKCDNDHELSCKACHAKHYVKDDWEGAYYSRMTTFYRDSMMYLQMEGEQYHANGTVPVMHTFTVSPTCKIDFLNESQ